MATRSTRGSTRTANRSKQETLSAEGVIEKMARNEKAFTLEGSDDWYSVYKQPQMNGAQVGDTVSFEYEEKDKGGATFRNIQGNVQIEEEGTRQPSRSSSSRSSGGGSSQGKVDYEAKDKRISRLSIMRGAIDLVVGTADFEGDVEAATEAAITAAEAIEAWVYAEEEE